MSYNASVHVPEFSLGVAWLPCARCFSKLVSNCCAKNKNRNENGLMRLQFLPKDTLKKISVWYYQVINYSSVIQVLIINFKGMVSAKN